MFSRLSGWFRRRKRPLDPQDAAAREEQRRSADQLLNARTLGRSGPRGFTGDTGRRS
jgi:hypothetical protein